VAWEFLHKFQPLQLNAIGAHLGQIIMSLRNPMAPLPPKTFDRRAAIPGEILTPRLWIEIYANSVYYLSILR
jgi:hypothetical protein